MKRVKSSPPATDNDQTPNVVDVPIEQFDFTEMGRLRDDDDPKTVKEYIEVFRLHTENGKLSMYPFPPCGVYQTSDGLYVPTAGRHRALAAKEAGVEAVPCIILSSETDAVWFGLGDNRKNGLRNSKNDLKKMIAIALQKYTDKSNRLIAEHIGCSPSSVDQIARQLRTNTQLPPTRTGRDRKQYSRKKPKRPKTEQPELESVTLSEVEDNEIQADSEPVTVEHDVPVDSLEPFDFESAVDSSDAHVEESQKAVASFELPDSSDPLLITKYEEWLKRISSSDEGRLNLSKPLFRRLLNWFEDSGYRLQFVQWVEADLKLYKR